MCLKTAGPEANSMTMIRYSVLCHSIWVYTVHTGLSQYFRVKYSSRYTVQSQQTEYRWPVYHGWFELAFESLRNTSNNRKQIFKEIFLLYHEIECCVHSLELPHRGNSNEYTQHTIIVQKIKKSSLNYRHLLLDLAPWLTLRGSNNPCLEQFSTVPKMFEPLKFDCISKVYKCPYLVQCQETWHSDINASSMPNDSYKDSMECTVASTALAIL